MAMSPARRWIKAVEGVLVSVGNRDIYRRIWSEGRRREHTHGAGLVSEVTGLVASDETGGLSLGGGTYIVVLLADVLLMCIICFEAV